MNNRQILYSYLLIFVFMLSFLWLGNFFFARQSIPFIQIVIVSLLHCFYSCALAVVITGVWIGNSRQRTWSVLGFIVLTATVIPIIQLLVYKLLPAMGVVFYDESKPKHMEAFYFRILRGYAWAFVFGMFIVVACKFVGAKKWISEKLAVYQNRVINDRYTSHFLSNLMLTSFGKNLIEGIPEDTRTKRDVIQFLAYHFEIGEDNSFGSWKNELDYLRCFIRLLQVYYGTAALRYKEDLRSAVYPQIPKGVLFFPLENCLKHALINAEHPLEFALISTEKGICLSCSNHWSPKEHMDESGEGLSLLTAKLEMADFNTEIITDLTNDFFHIQIHLNFNSYAKIAL